MDPDEDTEAEVASELEELGDFGDAPPPPPSPGPHGARSADPPAPPSAEFLALAKSLRSSPHRLEQGAMMFDILSASMADVLEDLTLNAAERRKELRTISAAAAKVFPLKEMHEATAKIDAFNAAVERRANAQGAALEERPTAKPAKVIPIRGSAVPNGRT